MPFGPHDHPVGMQREEADLRESEHSPPPTCMTLLDFVRTYWPKTPTPHPYQEEIDILVENMAAVGVHVSEDTVRRLITVPDLGPVFSPDVLSAFAEKSYRDPAAVLQPAKAEKKKRLMKSYNQWKKREGACVQACRVLLR